MGWFCFGVKILISEALLLFVFDLVVSARWFMFAILLPIVSALSGLRAYVIVVSSCLRFVYFFIIFIITLWVCFDSVV